jgi:hypothetical protein
LPSISRFYGITIMMYYNDHGRPHFHATYEGRRYKAFIWPLAFEGESPPSRVRSLVLEWAAMHQKELWENWKRSREGLRHNPIAPLE